MTAFRWGSMVLAWSLLGCMPRPMESTDSPAVLPPRMDSAAVRSQSPPQPPSPARNAGTVEPASASSGTVSRVTARVLARVNGQPILAEEVLNAASLRLAAARKQVPPAQWDQVREQILQSELEELINRELLLQDAEARIRPEMLAKVREVARKEFEKKLRAQRKQLGLRSDEEMRAYLERQGQSIEEMRRQYERSVLSMEYVRNLIRDRLENINRGDMLEYYRTHSKEFETPARVVWQHIFVDKEVFDTVADARRKAEEVHRRAKTMTTEEFAEMARDITANQGPSRTRNGLGEGNLRGEIYPRELEDVLFRTKPGQVAPIVETKRGFHIVRVIERTDGKKQSFEEACPEIRRKLQAEIGRREYERIIRKLRRDAYIENGLAK